MFNPHTRPDTRATAGDRAPAKMGQGQHHPSLGNGKHGVGRGGVPPRLVYICLAGTLTDRDRGNKQKGGFREGGGVCLWDNHSRGWGEGHEGGQQYSFRSKGHRKERLPSIISGETSGGSLTFVSSLHAVQPNSFPRCPMCLEGGAGARRRSWSSKGSEAHPPRRAGQGRLLCLSACHRKANLAAIPNSLARELAKVLKTSSLQPCSSLVGRRGPGGGHPVFHMSAFPMPLLSHLGILPSSSMGLLDLPSSPPSTGRLCSQGSVSPGSLRANSRALTGVQRLAFH